MPKRLRFLEREERYSVYLDHNNKWVLIAHGPGMRVLVYWSELDLTSCYEAYAPTQKSQYYRQANFHDHVCALVADPDEVEIVWCSDCKLPMRDDDEFTWIDDGAVCESCLDANWTSCYDCEEYSLTSLLNTTMDDVEVCSACIHENYRWCDVCDGWYRDEYGGHEHSCECASPAFSFTIPNDGNPPLCNDEQVEISLPAGVITEEGLYAIQDYLRRESYEYTQYDDATCAGLNRLRYDIGTFDPNWQRKDGNFTKRLSRYAYKTFGVKIPSKILSQIGNIARDHCAGAEYAIEVTRDLNMTAEEFGHEDSCWWGGYESSRCALKSNGGFGMRDLPHGEVRGRAWVMPLKTKDDGDLTPTFDAQNAAAYVVFNGYGSLSGYTATRILAHMTGMTYRKIRFTCSPMYVNNSSGYLVAPEDIAERYTDGDLDLSVHTHANLFELERAEVAATTEKELAHA